MTDNEETVVGTVAAYLHCSWDDIEIEEFRHIIDKMDEADQLKAEAFFRKA